jgi:hypothetical protein
MSGEAWGTELRAITKGNLHTNSIRRFAATAALAGVAIGLNGATASAGPPTTVTDSFSFSEDDPCTTKVDPNEMVTTISFEASLHDHPNNVVQSYSLTVRTSAGYVGSGACEASSER